MERMFEVASGSIQGRDHRHALRNNQDSSCILQGSAAIIAVVADGCSSGLSSEVGAHVGARLIATGLMTSISRGREAADALECVRMDVLAQIRLLAHAMGGSLSQTVNDYFLFTALVAIITPARTTIAGIGDGLYAWNGSTYRVGPFPNNEPPYLAYGIVKSRLTEHHPELLTFTLHEELPTEQIRSLAIATDGACELAEAADRQMPGRAECVGSLSQFWEDDRFFRNPFILRRKLNLINPPEPFVTMTDGGGIERREGLLSDDTTLIVVRRRKGA